MDVLKEKTIPVAEKVGNLEFVQTFSAYIDTLSSVEQKALAIRRQLRRNTDIFIAYKSLEDIITKQIPDLQIYSSYSNLNDMSEEIPITESYSQITNDLETSLGSLNVMRQLLEQNVYGNLDTLHLELINTMMEFNNTLSSVRRLPADIQNLEQDIEVVNNMLQKVKASGGADQVAKIKEIETEIGEHVEFANTGTEESVYGIFSKKIINPGYIYMEAKSWEEEE